MDANGDGAGEGGGWCRSRAALLLLALGCGALLPLALAPFDWWPLGILSIGGWFWLLDGRRPGFAAALGYAYGIGKFGLGVSWVYVSIRLYGNASLPLAGFLVALFVAGLALFPLLQAWIYRKIASNRAGLLNAWLFAALWVAFEWLLSWFLTGFPWLYPGYGHLQTPLANLIPLGGVSLASLGVAMSGAFLATAALSARKSARKRPARTGNALQTEQGGVKRPARKLPARTRLRTMAFLRSVKLPARKLPARACAWAALTLAAAPWLAGAALSGVDWVRPGAARTVALVQGNVDQAQKWLPENRQPIVSLHLALTEPHWGRDLIVWPEAAITFYEHQAESLLRQLDERGKREGSALVLGIASVQPAPDAGLLFHNSALALGEGRGRYAKRRLAPFGDYLPWESQLRGLIDFFDLPMSSFAPGPWQQPPLDAGAGQAALAICYEVAYGGLMRRSAAAADLLLTISNDTWFGSSIGPLQHFQIARARALENGRWLLRSANSGVTAIVDHRGRVVAALPQFQRGALTGEFRTMQGRTPYSRHGDSWLILLCLGSLAGGLLRRVIAAGRQARPLIPG